MTRSWWTWLMAGGDLDAMYRHEEIIGSDLNNILQENVKTMKIAFIAC